jgi:quinol monooxygenase YgiN
MKVLMNTVMRGLMMVLFGAAQVVHAQAPAAAPAASAPAPAVPAGPVYMVTYIETVHADKAKVVALLKQEGKASRAAAGNFRYDVLQRRDRPNHFAIIEVWRDQAAEDANLASASTRQFREKLKPMLSSAYDQRPHSGMAVGGIEAGAGAKGAAVYVVTHVDIIPPKKDEGIAALNKLAGPSRADAGALRYEVLQQNSRPNHFTLVEIWTGQAALEKHEVTAHIKDYREGLSPMSGSLYDQRLYKLLE